MHLGAHIYYKYRLDPISVSAIASNRELEGLIRDGVRIEFKDKQGRNRREWIKIIDLNNPTANQFLAVTAHGPADSLGSGTRFLG